MAEFNTPKLGTNLNALNYDWYYDWVFNYIPDRDNDPRYARMVWCLETSFEDKYGVTHTITETAREDFNRNWRGRVWLVYNEPDVTSSEQCGGQPVPGATDEHIYQRPDYAAEHFSEVYDMIKTADPYARVFGGGVATLMYPSTQNWWRSFVTTLQTNGALYKLEGVHIHLYPYVSSSLTCTYPDTCISDLAQSANTWYSSMHVGLGLGDRPIWITEMGWLGCYLQSSREWIRDNVMTPMSQWFARDANWPYPQVSLNPGYSAVAWYPTYVEQYFTCGSLLSTLGPAGTPTPLGANWNGFHP